MRHNKKFNHLGRTAAHRKAMLSNMANSLIMHKRISTTVAKAKALKVYIEPIITKAKKDTTHSRRMVFQKLQNKYAVTELFSNVVEKVGDRPGGYTRILKIGRRQGDDAMMCLIELVDFNEDRVKESKKATSGKRTRRSRRKKSDEATATTEATAVASKETKVEESKVEEIKVEQAKVETTEVEEPATTTAEATEEVAETPSTEDEANA